MTLEQQKAKELVEQKERVLELYIFNGCWDIAIELALQDIQNTIDANPVELLPSSFNQHVNTIESMIPYYEKVKQEIINLK